MPEMHLRQRAAVFKNKKKAGFTTYSACGPFTKHEQRIQKFMETGDVNYIYKNELDKACFQHDMAYNNFKDLKRSTQPDNVLKDKAFKIASDAKYDGYQRVLASMVYKLFNKKIKRSWFKRKSTISL